MPITKKAPAKAKPTMQSIGGKACLKKHGPDFYRLNALKRHNPKASAATLKKMLAERKKSEKKRK